MKFTNTLKCLVSINHSCLAPSQPVRLSQGEQLAQRTCQTAEDVHQYLEGLGVYQMLVFNAQPTGMVISRQTTSRKDLPTEDEVHGTAITCQTQDEVHRTVITCQTQDEVHGTVITCQTQDEVHGTVITCQTEHEVHGTVISSEITSREDQPQQMRYTNTLTRSVSISY